MNPSLTIAAALLLAVGPASARAASVYVPYDSCFKRSATTHDVSAALLKAVAATESNFNPSARSHANAHGVMQIQWPGTAKHLGVQRVSQLYSPCKNIDLGARYLRELLDKYAQNERRALAAYNYGPGRIKASGALPRGALKYVATVRRHQQKLAGSSARAPHKTPKDTLKVKSRIRDKSYKKQSVATFSSRIRAKRYAALLQTKLPAASFAVRPGRFGRHAVVLTSNAAALSADGRILLTSLGWKPLR